MTAAGVDSSELGADKGAPRTRRIKRLRSNRLQVNEAMAPWVHADGEHMSTGAFRARVVDLSTHGVRLALEMSVEQANLIQLGDHLQSLTIACGGRSVFVGTGTVARVIDQAGHVEVGVELSRAAVELDHLHRFTMRQSAQQRWEQTREQLHSQQVPAAFRAWVNELETFLDGTKRFLDREEEEMRPWDRAMREAVSEELLDAVAKDVIARMETATRELNESVATLPPEAQPTYRAFVQSRLNAYLEHSPFMRRAKQKPLGYAGDYEMMNMLYRDHREGDSLFAKTLNMFFTQMSAARANINRIEYIGTKIRDAIAQKPEGRVRIASIGCGPAHEIVSLLTKYPELGPRVDIALIDQERQALAQCERTLAPLAARTNAKVRVIRDSARRLMSDRQLGSSLGECDLIYSAGLFDYLSERAFSVLLGVLYQALVPGGSLLVGNVAIHNTDRGLMEYAAEWFLHHRSPEELLARAVALRPTPKRYEVEAEPTGINLFLIVERGATDLGSASLPNQLTPPGSRH